MIGQTPLLEFKTVNPNPNAPQEITIDKDGNASPLKIPDPYVSTELTGRYLQKAILEFDQTTGQPQVSLQFNDEGSKLFEKITRANVGKPVAIFLDGQPISTPTVNEPITGGKAQITGNFKPEEAKTLVGRLNSGALPVPIDLISTQTIGPTLGARAARQG
jgi:preprotein translocase subunit SecD